MIKNPHLAQVIHRLVVQSGADHVKRRHGQHHHHAAGHAGGQRHQPAVLREHLKEPSAWKKKQKKHSICAPVKHAS